MAENSCAVDCLLRTMDQNKTCPRCRQTKQINQFSLTKKKMPGKVCDKCRAKAQTRRTEFMKMKQQIDNEFMDMCKNEGIPIYTNDEYKLFGQIEVDGDSDASWGGKGHSPNYNKTK